MSQHPVRLVLPQDQSQKSGIREIGISRLTNDDQIHRWNDEHSLIVGADRRDQIAGRFAAEAIMVPVLKFPRNVQHLFDVHFARKRIICSSVEPESHTEHWIRPRAPKTLANQVT